MILCRICLKLINEPCLDITSSYYDDKTLAQLMETITQIKIGLSENYPRHICVPCSRKLQRFYTFRNEILKVEKNLNEKNLALVEVNNATMICFREAKHKNTRLSNVSDSKETENVEEIQQERKTESDQSDLMEITESTSGNNSKIDIPAKDEIKILDNDISEKPEVEEKVLTDAKRHVLNDKSSNVGFSCEQCGLVYWTEAELVAHKKKFHPEKPFVCEICLESFATNEEHKTHKTVHNHKQPKPSTCQTCGNNLVIMEHVRSKKGVPHVKNRIGCKFCDKKGKTTEQPRQFYLKERISQFPCDICKRVYKTEYAYNNHMRLAHSEPEKPKTECEICGRILSSSKEYQEHKKTHSVIKLKCTICEGIFSDRPEAITHLNKEHPDRAQANNMIIFIRM